MPTPPRHACICVCSNALAHNLARVKQLAPAASVLSMVKANAYGHGLAVAVNALTQTDAFGVACFGEAVAVRALSNKLVVVIEGAFTFEEWQAGQVQQFAYAIHCNAQLQWALDAPLTDRPVWLKVNTGMNRLGFTPDAAFAAYEKLHAAGYAIILTMHFANADTPAHPLNDVQIEQFLQLKMRLERHFGRVATSVCNSAGIFKFAELHGDWVRPGIMLYGSSPFGFRDKNGASNAANLGLQAAMRFEAAVVATYPITKGASVGYGSTWQALSNTQIAVISAGYGDGYPRMVNGACVAYQGKKLPIIGRVSMDMLMVDASAVVDGIGIGDVVELWGAHQSIDEVAHCAGTISYELMCRLTERPTRS